MGLSAGAKLGPYEILSIIGAGGMGEVYRARDPRVGRDVAIKVSAEQFSDRFSREIHAVAALNHPNIATLYDVGPNYLVMELVEGPTLAERIRQDAIPLEEALEIARQIADALEAAHEKGIIHRDLKPANIKIKPDGMVKVLDFGLAKVGGTPAVSSENSPTLSVAPTAAGVILGTAAYMSPEQAKGKPVDKRSDIWSFGVVLYEILTGHRLFEGETLSDTLASVIKAEPEWNKIPAETKRLLRSCLQKDPRQRLADIADARLLLEPAPELEPARRPWLAWSVSALCLFVALTLALVYFRQATPSLPVITFTVPPPNEGVFMGSAGAPRMSLSPDGRYLAFMASGGGKANQMWIRRLDSLELRSLNGTERAESPTWSPDSRYICFFVDGKLKKVEVAGGPVQTLCDAPRMNGGGSWNQEGEILFGGQNEGLKLVSAEGGNPTPVTALDPSRTERGHQWPQFLPDGRHFIYFSFTEKMEDRAVFIGSLDSKPVTRLMYSESMAAYAPPGYLLYLREGTLMARAFDAARLRFTGDARPVAESVILASNGRAAFSISAAGILAYRTGSSAISTDLTWFDRSGKDLGRAGQSGTGTNPRISPDNKRVAVRRGGRDSGDLWIIDLARDIPTRFTFDPGAEASPVWSPDGSRIAFTSVDNPPGACKLIARPASGFGKDELLLDSKEAVVPTDWSTDGNVLMYQPLTSSRSIWALRLQGDRKPFQFRQSSTYYLGQAHLSPDGRWIAYVSGESGNVEVYVENFPDSRGKLQISIGGGTSPQWRHDGKEIFYLTPDGSMMAVLLQGGSNLEPGTPARLFQTNFPPNEYTSYGVTVDGQRFLMPSPPKDSSASLITVVFNWLEQLKK